ncbi:MAG: hypothetical protein KA314_13550 [Chloroflexi bacterium]|nr:hypothetical protein [Chloroflexota bacterium]
MSTYTVKVTKSDIYHECTAESPRDAARLTVGVFGQDIPADSLIEVSHRRGSNRFAADSRGRVRELATYQV